MFAGADAQGFERCSLCGEKINQKLIGVQSKHGVEYFEVHYLAKNKFNKLHATNGYLK